MAGENIGRGDVAGIIPVEYSNAFLDDIIENSVALNTFSMIRLGTKVTTFPVLSALPTTTWVAETAKPVSAVGIKPTTEVSWENKVVTAEELAAIVPIHEDVLADSTVDLFAYIRPLVAQAMAEKVDGAIFFGTTKPTSFAQGLVQQATAAGQVHPLGVDETVADGMSAALSLLEEKGFNPTQGYAGPAFRGSLRNLKNETGDYLYASVRGGDGGAGDIWGIGLEYVKNGAWLDAQALAVVADRRRCVVGVRSDMEYKVLSEATLSNGANPINLAERDMVALRVKFRMGWEVATTATALGGTLPVAALIPGTQAAKGAK
jgi:HK97 family phage major capsid protein